MRKVDDSFREMMEGYGLTTAHVFYHLPDARSILGEFIWQFNDIYPRFPRLQKFLKFWNVSIEAPIHSVVIGHQKLIKPAEISLIGSEYILH